jgi:hypothetical protein
MSDTISSPRPGLARRIRNAIRSAFQNGLLGQSGWNYVKGYTGGDAYWNNMLAQELARPAAAPGDGQSAAPRPLRPGSGLPSAIIE